LKKKGNEKSGVFLGDQVRLGAGPQKGGLISLGNGRVRKNSRKEKGSRNSKGQPMKLEKEYAWGGGAGKTAGSKKREKILLEGGGGEADSLSKRISGKQRKEKFLEEERSE